MTIATVLLFILISALGMAALRHPSSLLANAVFSVALLVISVALIGSAIRRGPARAYWCGFSILGGGYLVLSSGPWLDREYSGYLVTTAIMNIAEPAMIAPEPPQQQPQILIATPGSTSKAWGSTAVDITGVNVQTAGVPASIYASVSSSTPVGVAWGAPAVNPPPSRWAQWIKADHAPVHSNRVGAVTFETSEGFTRIGHSLLALLLGLLGGLIGRGFAAKNDRDAGAAQAQGTST
jgi:hypothetical protein